METVNKAQQWSELSLQDALVSLERMPHSDSVENLTFILQNCRKHKNPAYALRLHAYLSKTGLETHKSLGNYLVPMLVEAGSICDAQQLFDRLVDRNEYAWTSLIAGYVECGDVQHAFVLHQKMQEEAIRPSGHTYVALLKGCARLKDTERGQELHGEIVRKGLLERDPFVASTLVDMYAKCGLLAKAQEVFDGLPVRNAVSWTALIAGYAEHNLGQGALNCFEQMQLEGVSPTSVTFVCSLKACGIIRAMDKGQEIHSQIAAKGLLERDLVVGNTLVDMYAKCGLLVKAQEVFDKLPVRDAVSWNTLIAGYAEHNCGQHALNCLEQMQLEDVCPTSVTFVCSLKACGNIGAVDKGQEIHAQIATKVFLERDPFVASTLVDMYAKCGLLAKAEEVFEKLSVRDAASWNALIRGYAEHNLGQAALNCFEQMQLEGVSPTSVTFVCSLKACGSTGAIDNGQEIHAQIVAKGLLERDLFVSNSLVDMYAKCGLLAKAQEVFDELPVRDAVSWNALIAGYAEHNLGQDALNCFEHMQLEGVSPDAVTFFCILKACGSIGAIEKGQEIHAQIATQGLLERDPFVASTLVDMYAKCGFLAIAQEVLNKLPVRDAVSWNALIAGYAEHSLGQDALNCFEQMQLEGVCPTSVTFICSLKACGSIGNKDKGLEIHAQVATKGLLERDPFIGSTLVDMYAKCGLPTKAQEVFDKLPLRDAVSWTALIAGYTEHNLGQDALNCFEQMQLEGVPPTSVTVVCSLKACGSMGAIDKGHEIHAQIATKRLFESDPFVGNTLVDMYAKCGLLSKAQGEFDKLPFRDAVSWNALIAGYVVHNFGQDALNCFEQMQFEGISPDAVTFICSLKACGSIRAIDRGQEIHAQIATQGFLERDPFVASTLVDMYAKCGFLAIAQEVFDKVPVRDAVSWNTLIAGYAERNLGQDALNCFEQMRLEGISPNAATFVCSLKACSSIGAIDKGQEIHAQIATKVLFDRDPFVGNTLIDVYAKCGLLSKAQEVLDKLPVRDVVSWTAIIAGYAEDNLGQDALNCFEQMQLEGFSPDAVTFVCTLKACGSIRAIDKGQEIHAQIATKGLLERNLFVGNTLMDMYAKCGLLAKAEEVFDKLPVRDAFSWTTLVDMYAKCGLLAKAEEVFAKLPARNAVSWNALIAGYAQLGECENVFLMLDRMRAEGTKPDGVTFLSILNVCSHSGLVEKGETYFQAMSKDYGIIPTIEHHNCMVDLLGRAGQLDKAVLMIKRMPFNHDLALWHTLLGACQKWGNVELGRWAFDHAVELDRRDAAVYVLLSNIYVDAHMREDSKQFELMRLKEKSWKELGHSWSDTGRIVHSFLVGDTQHSQSNYIDDLSFKIREQECVPVLHRLSKDISADVKESELCWQ